MRRLLTLFALLSINAFAWKGSVTFAGKTIKIECPKSPVGETLSWVNKNCTAQMPTRPSGGNVGNPSDTKAPSGGDKPELFAVKSTKDASSKLTSKQVKDEGKTTSTKPKENL